LTVGLARGVGASVDTGGAKGVRVDLAASEPAATAAAEGATDPAADASRGSRSRRRPRSALRTIEVYESITGRPTLVATARDADVVRLPPFDAELSLGTWWKAPSTTALASP
jgi:hypothetical protein